MLMHSLTHAIIPSIIHTHTHTHRISTYTLTPCLFSGHGLIHGFMQLYPQSHTHTHRCARFLTFVSSPQDIGRFMARAVADDCLAPAFINSHPGERRGEESKSVSVCVCICVWLVLFVCVCVCVCVALLSTQEGRSL